MGFMSSSGHIDRLFFGVLDRPQPSAKDLPSYMLIHGKAVSLHTYLRWHLQQAGLENQLRRFQYHHLDYTFVREKFFHRCLRKEVYVSGSPWRLFNPFKDFEGWKPLASNESQCDAPYYYCSCNGKVPEYMI